MIQRKYYKTIRVIVDSDGGGTPLYIENIDTVPGYFMLGKSGSPTYTPNLNYRIDNGEWFEYDVVNRPRIEVPVGSKIYLKGNNTNGVHTQSSSSNYYNLGLYTTSTGWTGCKFNIGGYITSLLALDNFHLINHIPNNSFSNLFYNNTSLVSADNLITSNVTSVGGNSFKYCFYKCTSLVTAPTFENVTSVGSSCFMECFNGCTSLVTAPTFENVTSVAFQGFSSCFYGCTSLVTAPTFENVTSVGDSSFSTCFKVCTALVIAPTFENVTSIEGKEAFSGCFEGCTSLVTAPTFENVTSVGGDNMYDIFRRCFYGCTSLVTSPNFRKVTKVSGYYSFENCFYGCTSLETIIAPRTSSWSTNNFGSWVQNVPTSGTFYKKKGLTIPTGTNGIPEGWTVVEEA